jgi:hypothetical protein
MKQVFNGVDVTLINEPNYSVNSNDNVRGYEIELCRDRKYQHSSAQGLYVGDVEHPESYVILLGTGGATGVHEYSLTINHDTCYVASGDAVFSLRLPSLELIWVKKVDFATCFGVFWVTEYDCLITWGEMDICRFDKDGNKIWSVSGPEIFTEGFEFCDRHVIVKDFDGNKYKISIESGVSMGIGM